MGFLSKLPFLNRSQPTDYRRIYDHCYVSNEAYLKADNSPGLLWAKQLSDIIAGTGPRHLDIGCGAGFVMEFLSAPPFNKQVHGADISPEAVKISRERVPHADVKVIEGRLIPFGYMSFDLITCFDVLEHLDEPDVLNIKREVDRMLAPGGTFIASIATRPSMFTDINGENLHRTVQNSGWWQGIFEFDTVQVHGDTTLGFKKSQRHPADAYPVG